MRFRATRGDVRLYVSVESQPDQQCLYTCSDGSRKMRYCSITGGSVDNVTRWYV